ncbi:plastocyanin/azurin family copper-binding protein [Paenibacillus sp. R14(2021)]|uniref:plastocyanin/azurin family copper-binding protein n=1 Tax=Paenibacillus sp. R14(2021) TaxID=2859228 RepID=UPI001C6168EF|nr:plastocyanin/azurin family copper-binding protein [Paenibacillus sp. R14(2021)]
MKKRRFGLYLILLLLCAALLIPSINAAAEDNAASVTTDGQTAAKLGLLLGDGSGVSESYLSKSATRLQAAIISLRLQGYLTEAMAYKGSANFADAASVGAGNQAVLGYLKDHPELGWNGMGNGKFLPLEPISSQQLYKVLLEALGFRSGTDFTYAATESFAAGKGLDQIAGATAITNAHIATALIEALAASAKDGASFFGKLQERGVIPASAVLPTGERLRLHKDAKLGTLFTDKQGRTLYFFTKDAADLNSCTGDCLKAWPIYHATDLQIPAALNAGDFGVLKRPDGTEQTTYKSWPLYYFVKDQKPGDTLGEGVGGVWFAAKSDYAAMLGTSAALGNYLTDANGRTLYYFDKDTVGKSVCEGTCLANWPAYHAAGTSVPTGIAAADWGTITRSDGSQQSTFKGYPLYYFVKDKAHGDTLGQDVNQVWFVVNPATFSGTTAPVAKTYHVDIKEYSFGTGPLTVEAGSSIVFTNFDDMQHNAVDVDGSFATPLLSKGDSYTITLSKPGVYDYFCVPHKKFMTGQIIVK